MNIEQKAINLGSDIDKLGSTALRIKQERDELAEVLSDLYILIVISGAVDLNHSVVVRAQELIAKAVKRSSEQDAAIDEAIHRLDKVMGQRRENQGFSRPLTVEAIMRAAIVIESNTPQELPGFEHSPHWFDRNRNGFFR